MHSHYTNFNWRKILFFSAGFLFTAVLAISCKKHTNTLGSSALNPENMLKSGGIDTFSLRTFTILDSNVRTDIGGTALLGAYHDPKVGVTNAEMYFQLRINTTPTFQSTDQIIVDSMVLALEYTSFYGNTDPQTFEVYRLLDTLGTLTPYYSYSTKKTDPSYGNNGNIIDPARQTITPIPSSTTIVGTDTLSPQLRLSLDTNMAKEIMQDAKTGNIGFLSNDNFTGIYFKGLKVKVSNSNPASGTGGIFYFNLNDNDTKLTIYYRLASNLSNPLELDFISNQYCAHFNHVEISNVGTHMADVIHDTVSGASQFYAQAFNARAVVQFDGIENLPKKSVVQNAVLVLPVAYQTYSPYYPSDEISVSTRISYDDPTFYSLGVTSLYDDILKRYVVDVRDYVQAVISGVTVNTGVVLSPRVYSGSAERIIFNGPNTTNKDKPKLIVTYTEY